MSKATGPIHHRDVVNAPVMYHTTMSHAISGLHLNSGHLGTQSFEDVSGESGWTTIGQSISEVRVARMSEAKVAGPPMGQGISKVRIARMSQTKVA